jgi:hypothetical protein
MLLALDSSSNKLNTAVVITLPRGVIEEDKQVGDADVILFRQSMIEWQRFQLPILVASDIHDNIGYFHWLLPLLHSIGWLSGNQQRATSEKPILSCGRNLREGHNFEVPTHHASRDYCITSQ